MRKKLLSIVLFICLVFQVIPVQAMDMDRVLGHCYAIQAYPKMDNPKILMVGNSHTRKNDIPGMLRSLCITTGIKAEVASVVSDGYTLYQYVFPKTDKERTYSDKLNEYLESQQWDYIILQGRRGEETLSRSDMMDAIRVIKSKVPYDTKVVLYMPWQAKCPEEEKSHQATTIMDIAENYYSIAGILNCALAPSGVAFERAKFLFPQLNLYVADRKHATVLGSYLSACTIFATLFGIDPQTVPYYGGNPVEDAQKMQKIAAGLTTRHIVIPEVSHTIMIEQEIAATCKNEGRTEGRHCLDCGQIIVASEVIPKTGIHTWSDWKVTQKATVSKTGEMSRACSVCGETEKEVIPKIVPATVKTKAIVVNKKSVVLKAKKQFKIVAAVQPANSTEKISYASSNNKIAKVSSNGVIKGLKKGKATITVKSGSKRVKIRVTVK